MVTTTDVYAARLNVDYPEKLDRVTTAFRLIWVIPISIVLSLLAAQATSTVTVITTSGQFVSQVSRSGAGIAGGLFAATLLMILFRQRYPRWWFDFALQFNRFAARVAAYCRQRSKMRPMRRSKTRPPVGVSSVPCLGF